VLLGYQLVKSRDIVVEAKLGPICHPSDKETYIEKGLCIKKYIKGQRSLLRRFIIIDLIELECIVSMRELIDIATIFYFAPNYPMNMQ